MKRLLFIAIVLLLASPIQAQVTTFFARYVADGSSPGDIPALSNGDELCPPNSDCIGYDQAHHHILHDGGTYQTDVLDAHNCRFVTVCVRTADTDGDNPAAYVRAVLNNSGDIPTKVLADFNGDGVVDDNDNYALDGDDGTNNDNDATTLQLSCIYDITGVNKIELNITDDGDDSGDPDDSYAEISCR